MDQLGRHQFVLCNQVCIHTTPHHQKQKHNPPKHQTLTEALLEVGEEGEGLVAQPVPEPRLLGLEPPDFVDVRELRGEQRAGVALALEEGPLGGEEAVVGVCVFIYKQNKWW
jgi:hypothetical protein